MLHCDFPLGRPLGKPADAEFQHRVLAAAFELLPRSDVPVLVDFPESITDEADAPLACALPPRHDPTLHPAIDEVLGVKAAYERRRAATGATNVVRFGGAERIPELVGAFVRIVSGTPWESAGIEPDRIADAARDIRAYYEEVALELAGHVPAARQAESWFYRVTETGAVLMQAQAIIRDADAPRTTWFPIVPTGHQPR